MPEMAKSVATTAGSGVQEKGLAQIVTGKTFQLMMAQSLPDLGVTSKMLTRIVLTEYRKIPKLAECTPESFVRAVMVCAELGLVPGSSKGQCWILPYRNHGQMEATWQLGYPGAKDLAFRSDMIEYIEASTVYKGEQFEIQRGTNAGIHHIPATDWDPDRDVLGFYCTLRVKGAHRDTFHWMSLGEVEAFKKQYVRSKSGPWFGKPTSNEFRWMAQKTCWMQLRKLAPSSSFTPVAANADDRGIRGAPPEIDITPPRSHEDASESELLEEFVREGREVAEAGGFGAEGGGAAETSSDQGPAEASGQEEVIDVSSEPEPAKTRRAKSEPEEPELQFASAKGGEPECGADVKGSPCHRGEAHPDPCENKKGETETIPIGD